MNVSLDAIDDDIFKNINGRNINTKPVIKGIIAAKEAGLEVKVNMVVKRDERSSSTSDGCVF